MKKLLLGVGILTGALFCSGEGQAEGYVRFTTTRLFCVIKPEGNDLRTYHDGKGYDERSVKTVIKETRKALKNGGKAKKALKRAKVQAISYQRKQQLSAQLDAVNVLIGVLKETRAFVEACGQGKLNSLATSSPILPH